MVHDDSKASLQVLARIPQWQGTDAVYHEGRFLALVRVRKIRVTTKAVRVVCELIESVGVLASPGTSWDVASVWSDLRVTAASLHSRNVPWGIYFGAELVRRVREAKAELPADSSAEQRWNLRVTQGGNRQARIWHLLRSSRWGYHPLCD